MSNDSYQDAATTTAHMSDLIQQLLMSNKIKKGKSTIMEDTDSCAKQYRCATAFYLLSRLAVQFDVVIDRAVGAPGHGKGVVDGLNALDKMFLCSAMFCILFPEETMNSKICSFILPHSMKVLVLQMSAGNFYNIMLTTFLQL